MKIFITCVCFCICMLASLPQSKPPVRQVIPLALKLSPNHYSYQQELTELTTTLKTSYSLTDQKANAFAPWIIESSLFNDVPKPLLAAVIMTESSFRIKVVSSAGAIGPAQIMPIWRNECGDITDPRTNINCSGTILRHYYETRCHQNWECTLKMYNVGPSNMRKPMKFAQAKRRYYYKVSRFLSLIDTTLTI